MSARPRPDQALRHLHRARRTSRSTSARASSFAFSARRAAARPHCCAPSPGLDPQNEGTIDIGGRDVVDPAAVRARLRHRVPVLCAVSEPDGRRECRLRPRQPPDASRPHIATRVADLLALVGLADQAANIQCSCPAASSSAWRLRGRSRRRPACCCSTSRSRRSTRTCASACATRSRRCSAGSASPPSW